MAELCVSTTLHCFFKEDSPIKFKITLCYKGRLKEGRVNGLDAIEKKKELEYFVRKFEYKIIKKEVENYGIKFRGMESLALLILRSFPEAEKVEIKEGDDEKVILLRNDVE